MIQGKITKHNTSNNNEFPKLMISELGFVVLVTGRNKEHTTYVGTVVSSSDYWNIGYHSEKWNTSLKDFYGTISIDQD